MNVVLSGLTVERECDRCERGYASFPDANPFRTGESYGQ